MLFRSLGIWASGAQPAANAGSFESIATVTVGSGGSSTITFSSIPSTYTHLQVRLLCRQSNGDTSNNIYLKINNDTASNYTLHDIYGDGSSVSVQGAANQSQGFAARVADSAASSSIFGVGIIDILDYANTNKYKTVRSLSGEDRNGAGNVYFISSLWRSTSAITELTFQNGTVAAQYSHFALYGIKS